MIVVDANVIAYLLMRGKRSEAMDRLQDFDSEWVAPRLWLDEFLNVLCTYQRNGGIGSDQAVELLDDALALMEGNAYEVPPERVLTVARIPDAAATTANISRWRKILACGYTRAIDAFCRSAPLWPSSPRNVKQGTIAPLSRQQVSCIFRYERLVARSTRHTTSRCPLPTRLTPLSSSRSKPTL